MASLLYNQNARSEVIVVCFVFVNHWCNPSQVPRALPYFAVDFGLQGGFAHVIENEQKFPHYFGKVSVPITRLVFGISQQEEVLPPKSVC